MLSDLVNPSIGLLVMCGALVCIVVAVVIVLYEEEEEYIDAGGQDFASEMPAHYGEQY
jgi:hypothetical protein